MHPRYAWPGQQTSAVDHESTPHLSPSQQPSPKDKGLQLTPGESRPTVPRTKADLRPPEAPAPPPPPPPATWSLSGQPLWGWGLLSPNCSHIARAPGASQGMPWEVHRFLQGLGFQLLGNRWTDVCGTSRGAARDPHELSPLERRASLMPSARLSFGLWGFCADRNPAWRGC